MNKEDNKEISNNKPAWYSKEATSAVAKYTIMLMFSGYSILFAVKLFSIDLTSLITTIDFATMLSTILALFAIGLSIAFYFESSNFSQRFYDHTFKFIKDIHLSLGKMEERFGTQMEEHTRLQDKIFNHLSFNKEEAEKKQKEIDELNQQIEKIKTETNNTSNPEEKKEKSEKIAELSNKLKEKVEEVETLSTSRGALLVIKSLKNNFPEDNLNLQQILNNYGVKTLSKTPVYSNKYYLLTVQVPEKFNKEELKQILKYEGYLLS